MSDFQPIISKIGAASFSKEGRILTSCAMTTNAVVVSKKAFNGAQPEPLKEATKASGGFAEGLG